MSTQTAVPAVPAVPAVQQYHYLVTTFHYWSAKEDMLEALDAIRKEYKKELPRFRKTITVRIARVETPVKTPYAINWFKPVGVDSTVVYEGKLFTSM